MKCHRRRFLWQSSLFATSVMGNRSVAATRSDEPIKWFMPDEGGPHRRTWMAFGASEKIWGRRLLSRVRQDLAVVANTIAQFEPVSMLVRDEDVQTARAIVDPSVQLVPCPLDDLWIRDTGPTFVLSERGSIAGVDFNFNGWGKKQAFSRDAKVAAFVTAAADAPAIQTELVLEGGCIEVDGQGTAIITESCVLNPNRNPGVGKAQFERELMPLLGLEKIIWLPGIKGRDITDGHTDFYARFASPTVVIAGFDPDPASYDHAVTKQHIDMLRAATDAKGRALTVIVLEAPTRIRREFDNDAFAAGYVGYYLCNGAVVMQQFGDRQADRAAKKVLEQVFSDRQVIPVALDGIAAGGGSVHCATQQEPDISHG